MKRFMGFSHLLRLRGRWGKPDSPRFYSLSSQNPITVSSVGAVVAPRGGALLIVRKKLSVIFFLSVSGNMEALGQNQPSHQALLIGGGAPDTTLMAGALVAMIRRRSTSTDVVSTSRAGALIGLLYRAPAGNHKPEEALHHTTRGASPMRSMTGCR